VYTISGLSAGTYTLTPSKAGYIFLPVTDSATITTTDVTGKNFVGTYVAPKFTSSAPAAGRVGGYYSHYFAASGTPNPTFTLNSGSLPANLSLSGDGTLSGVATTAGTYNFVVKATNSAGTATQSVTLLINPALPAFTGSSPAEGMVGKTYSYTFTTNITGATITKASGSYPDGLTLTGATLSGTATTVGTFDFTMHATNGTDSADQAYSITIHEAIVFNSAPSGATGAVYNFGPIASGDPVPEVSLKAASGSLPTGLTLTSAAGGTLSGIPTAAGTYAFTLVATNSAGSTEQAFSISIAFVPNFTGNAPQPGMVTRPYSYTFTTNITTPTFTLKSGSFPSGLTLTGALLSGTADTAGTYNFTVTADNGTYTMDQAYSITIYPAITFSSAPAAKVGVAFSWSPIASGTPATPTVTLKTGSLPTGLTLASANGGTLSGTPTAAATYNFTLTATNSAGSIDLPVTIVVTLVPAFTGSAPTPGMVTKSYTYTFAVNFTTPTYTLKTGAYPTGLSLTGAVLSGTPSAAGTFNFTMTADNGTYTVDQAFSITIYPATVFAASAPDGAVGAYYSWYNIATGTPNPTLTLKTGSLPTGLSLNGPGGAITGIPTVGGAYTFTLTATNAGGTVDQQFTINIYLLPAFTGSDPTSGVVDSAYSYTFTASGTPTPTITKKSGSFPTGLTLTNGVLSGTPSAAGTFTFVMTATNTSGSTDKEFTIIIKLPVTVTISTPADAAVLFLEQPVTVTVSVAAKALGMPRSADNGSPTGTVTVSDGTNSCTITLGSATSCQLSLSSAGSKTITATYNGDTTYGIGTDTVSVTVKQHIFLPLLNMDVSAN
jgi:PKD repeat protein